MGSDRHEGEELKYHAVDDAVYLIRRRNEHNEEDDELGVQNQRPGHDGTNQATNVFHKPQFRTLWPADTETSPERTTVYVTNGVLVVRVIPALFHRRADYRAIAPRL